VYVTGTFDNWSKSEKLEKVGDHFEKTVTLPEATEAIFYKVRTRLLPTQSSCFLLRCIPWQTSYTEPNPRLWFHAAVLRRTERRACLAAARDVLSTGSIVSSGHCSAWQLRQLFFVVALELDERSP
jgi:hypothetical protein